MFASINWLKDYVKVNESNINKFASAMTLSGTMVEGYEHRAGSLKNIVTAKVLDIYPHPDSDHMFVCKISDGTDEFQVVTGAQNVHKGDIVPLAKPHSVVWGEKKIEKSKLRGIDSEGMLCSASELGIGSAIAPKHAQEGILLLPENTKLGVDILDYFELNDYIVEFELTNNRQDCNSILGIASEIAATYNESFSFPEYEYNDDNDEINKYLKVSVDDLNACKRYTVRMVKVKKIESSPEWMQNRLMSAGVRPINNIVDVSNFVMIETGQPLHTFDYNKLSGGEINVGFAKTGEKIITLDNEPRTLDENSLMINDANGHIAIAGIMGALNSDIDEATKMVAIESANFDKNVIRACSKRLGLRTEASAHFEKGLSIQLTKYAVDRAASLLVEIGACEYIGGIIDIHAPINEEQPVCIDINWFNAFTGISLSAGEAVKLLERLGFVCKTNGSEINAIAPRFRQDIACKEDLAEEIARIYGYDKIPMTLMPSSSYVSLPNERILFRKNLKQKLCAIGGYELLTYTFISPHAIEKLMFEKEDVRKYPELIINAYGEDYSAMRTSMICNMLETLQTNSNRNNADALLFEISNVFLKTKEEGSLPEQVEKIALAKSKCDYYYMKSAVDYLLDSLRLPKAEYRRSKEPYLHPGRSADVLVSGKIIGSLGQIHPIIAKAYEIEELCCVAELDFELIYDLFKNRNESFIGLSKFPSVERDLALVADEELMSAQIEKIIMKSGGEILISVSPFDVYRSEALGEGKKSIAYKLIYRSDTATLRDEQVEESISAILNAVESELGVYLRA